MTGESSKYIKLPYSFARRHGLLITEVSDGRAKVFYKHGADPRIICEVRRFASLPLDLEKAEPDHFDEILQRFYESDSSGAMQMAGDFTEELDLQSLAEQLPETEDLLESEDDAPIIRLLNGIFTEAVRENASDIHIEPFENRLQIRFRVDGVLREVLQPSRVLAPLF